MAHFVKINEGNVCGQVIVVRNQDILDNNGDELEVVGQAFIASIGLDGVWKQCSYNASFRGKYPQEGDVYDQENDVFKRPQVEE